jgi:hypothetical protein
MPVGFIIEVSGGTQQMYDQAMVELNVTEHPIDGLISHTAGPMEGGWRVIDVWQSDEKFGAFGANRLGPALQKVGMPEPKITRFEVHNFLRGSDQ